MYHTKQSGNQQIQTLVSPMQPQLRTFGQQRRCALIRCPNLQHRHHGRKKVTATRFTPVHLSVLSLGPSSPLFIAHVIARARYTQSEQLPAMTAWWIAEGTAVAAGTESTWRWLKEKKALTVEVSTLGSAADFESMVRKDSSLCAVKDESRFTSRSSLYHDFDSTRCASRARHGRCITPANRHEKLPTVYTLQTGNVEHLLQGERKAREGFLMESM